MDTIDTDLPCLRCGYNLRTLALEGICPECGDAVRDTELARALGPLKYRALRIRGETWMSCARDALRVGVGAWLTTLLATMVNNAHGDSPAGVSLYSVAFVLWCWFVWRLFQSPPLVVKAIGRGSVFVLVVGMTAQGLNERWADYYFGKVGPLPWPVGDRLFATTEAVARTLPYSLLFTLALAVIRVVLITWVARCLIILTIFSVLVAASLVFLGRPSLPNEVRMLIQPVRRILAFGVVATWIGLPVWFGSVHWRITRAIALGELPAASSRSSPFPRPPG